MSLDSRDDIALIEARLRADGLRASVDAPAGAHARIMAAVESIEPARDSVRAAAPRGAVGSHAHLRAAAALMLFILGALALAHAVDTPPAEQVALHQAPSGTRDRQPPRHFFLPLFDETMEEYRLMAHVDRPLLREARALAVQGDQVIEAWLGRIPPSLQE